MAPMIDMVFLLLVFFMTVSTMAKEARPELDLAHSVTAAVPEEAPPRNVLTVMGGEKGFVYYWHNRTVEMAELEKLLGESVGDGSQLLLRGPPGLPWEAWKAVVDACRGAGISDIIFATFEE